MIVRRQYHNLAGALATDGDDPTTVWEVAARITDYLTGPMWSGEEATAAKGV